MAREEIYITEIAEIEVCDGGFRATLLSGKKTIVLRGSLHTLTVGHNRAHAALQAHVGARVVRIPKRKKRGH